MSAAGQDVARATIGGLVSPSLTERLINERDQLTARLDEINAVLHRLEGQPELQATLDALAKLGQRLY